MNTGHITSLLALNSNLQIAHWVAPTVTNDHEILGNLYESMVGHIDKMSEVLIGKLGNRVFSPVQITLAASTGDEITNAFLDLFSEIQLTLNPATDNDLLSILAEMQSAVNRARFLLQSW